MDNYTYYRHHGRLVWVQSEAKGKHTEACLCHKCKKFKPGTEENCPIAQQNYEMCVEHDLVTPVWECPAFRQKVRVYMICPCRHASDETRVSIDAYVEQLEAEGCIVHYPPRDVEQNEEETTAHIIMQAHVKAMSEADEVHAWWDPDSKGSHVDFGMAYMMRFLNDGYNPMFVIANDPESTAERSFGNYFRYLCGCNPSKSIADFASPDTNDTSS